MNMHAVVKTRRLHLNEYRFSHHEEVIKSVRDVVSQETSSTLLTNYQEIPDQSLAANIAQYVGAPSHHNVLITAGSDEALRSIIETSTIRGHDTVIIGVPSYTYFEECVKLKGLKLITYAIGINTSPADHLTSLQYYNSQLYEGCTVYLCSPNNPTGDLWSKSTVTNLAKKYPKSLFIVDEAYIEFASIDLSLVSVALTTENVIVTRTFSKAFGLAALRIGYIIGIPEIIAKFSLAINPKAFALAAASAASAVLRHKDYYLANVDIANKESQYVVDTLTRAGWYAINTAGNFYLVYVENATDVVNTFALNDINIRNRNTLAGLAGFVRITAGSSDDSCAILEIFANIAVPKTLPLQHYYTNKGHIAQCKYLMKKTLHILRKSKIEFFATAGTMLGMYRHKGMIPWDDDCDLAYVRNSDRDQALDLIDLFSAEGLRFQRNRTDAYWQIGTNDPGTSISSVHIDFFSYHITKNATYELDDIRFRHELPTCERAHCNSTYSVEELYPLCTDYYFYDQMIPMPAQVGAVLNRSLGDDFMTTAKVRHGDGFLSFKLYDYSPA